MTWFLTDNVIGQTQYVWARDWDEAERICNDERLELIGEHVNTIIWWNMPRWMEKLSEATV